MPAMYTYGNGTGELRMLIRWPGHRNIILDYPGELNVITSLSTEEGTDRSRERAAWGAASWHAGFENGEMRP